MPQQPSINAIIQGRMGSSRLPGKLMMEIAGLPLLGHGFHQLRQSKTINKIILATSDQPQDDILADYAAKNGIACIRGSETNVLARFQKAVTLFPSDYIIRICSDVPFLDPNLIDQMMARLIADKGDLIETQTIHKALFGGIEPVSTQAFWHMAQAGKTDPIAMEHVTAYLYHHRPPWVRFTKFSCPEAYTIPQSLLQGQVFRLWVDTPKDLSLVQEIYDMTKAAPASLLLPQLRQLFLSHPELLLRNMEVKQKPIGQAEARLYLYAQMGQDIGMGHYKRLCHLGEGLRDQYGLGVRLGIHVKNKNDLMKDCPFPFDVIQNEQDLPSKLRTHHYAALIIDIKEGIEDLSAIKAEFPKLKIILIDDDSRRNLYADISFLPPLSGLPKAASNCQILSGLDYMILPSATPLSAAASIPATPRAYSTAPYHILLTMGGSDLESNMLYMLHKLAELHEPDAFKISLTLTPFMQDQGAIEIFAQNAPFQVDILRDIDNLASYIDAADLVICRFGITAYEVLARGRACLPLIANHKINDAMKLFLTLNPLPFYEDEPAILSTLIYNRTERRDIISHLASTYQAGKVAEIIYNFVIPTLKIT